MVPFFQILVFSYSNAGLSIKPGLWNVEMKISQNGKEFDPQAQIKAAFAKMSPDQRKKMESMMSQMGGTGVMGASEKGFKVCYTSELLKSEDILHHHSEKNCDTRFPIKTPDRLVAEFTCKNKTSGTADWKVLDSAHYEGLMIIKREGAEDSTMRYKASFVSADCGNIKPKK